MGIKICMWSVEKPPLYFAESTFHASKPPVKLFALKVKVYYHLITL